MNKSLIASALAVLAFACAPKEGSMEKIVTHALDRSVEQYMKMAETLLPQDSLLPRTFVNGELITSGSEWWCSGFFPGSLWYLYEYSGNDSLLEYAKKFTARVEKEKYTTSNHDVGFILNCSFGNGLRLTGDSSYAGVLVTGAGSLSTRFSDHIGLIRSWDFNSENWQYPVIIDNMMNLELMLVASRISGNDKFRDIALSHADKTMKYHYRPDFSSYHVVSFDTINGEPHKIQTHQGFSDESSWSRGQAWGLYGFTVMYRETKDRKYLDHATKIAEYLISHPNMPDDWVPYWDFDAPNIPDEPRDASAAAIMASALIELSGYVEANFSRRFLNVAKKQIRSLSSPEYLAEPGENGNFILKHGVGSFPHNSEVDVPLTYGDYYFIEALIRYRDLRNM